tara:strand:+ start:198 stop:881 length:684 start_codon:yes stop_codon:yes gene_type:complete
MKNKFAIIGLGQFGMTIAKTLSKKGAEVIAIDKDIDKVEHIKEYVSYAISLDATDKQALLNQNIEEMDAVIIAIGEDFKSMILCANILTELSIKRIIGRVMGENERLILKKLGISEILSPEDEIGKNITNSLLNPNIVFSLELPDNFLIAEIKSPEKLCGEKLGEIKLREDFGLNLITILRGTIDSNNEINHNIFGIPSADTIINKDDILILFGSSTDIKKFVEINS